MEVLIPELSGFCPGVKTAEKKLFSADCERNKIKIIGKLIHNRKYIEYLEKCGIETIYDINDIPDYSVVAVRTHGISKNIENDLLKKYSMIDLTCFKVKDLQKIIQEKSGEGFNIVISGKYSHPEVQSLISYACTFRVIETFTDADNYFEDIVKFKIENIFICSQTTGPKELFDYICVNISKIKSVKKLDIFNSICSITDYREKKAISLIPLVDASIVIGDNESSNAVKLFNKILEQGKNVFFVSSLEDIIKIQSDLSGLKAVQVVSSSSTPDFLENEIVEYIKKL